MTSNEAIIEVQIKHSAVTAAHYASDKTVLRAARRAYNIAAKNLWNAWIAEGHPERAGEYLSIYGICFAK